ncbi:MAG: DinB family protein [Phycisphaeraceae bacterium]|nr:DinB family protein [Phycisphaeraceae bacterium]
MSKKPAKKATKKTAKKAAKKVSKKTAKKGGKPVAKKAAKKSATRSSKKAAGKGAAASGSRSRGGTTRTATHAAKAGTRDARKPIKARKKAGGGKSAPAKAKEAAGAASVGAPAPASSQRSYALGARASAFARFACRMVADMAAGIPDEKSCEQLPGAANHKLWTLGHMAQSNQWFASLIDGQAITFPAEWDRLFGMGSKPSSDEAGYPPIADVRAAYEASIDRLCAAIESLDDQEIVAGPAGDGANFVHDKLDSALKGAWHAGWHLGQLAGLRKGLGLPSLMGG